MTKHVLLITPLPEEHHALEAAFAKRGLTMTPTRLGRLPAHQVEALGLTVIRGGHGKTQFGIQTTHALDHTSGFDLVISAGAGGAIAPQIEMGDLVAGTEIVEHDYVLRFVRRPLPRYAGDAGALAALRAVDTAAFPFTLHHDVIASGDEDVIERTRAEDIRTRTGAVIVAWEGVGGARACKFAGVPFVELRGATDNADHTAPGDFETNLGVVMDNVCALLDSWLRRA
jgi:adenosylhomocysteine nucleosidase